MARPTGPAAHLLALCLCMAAQGAAAAQSGSVTELTAALAAEDPAERARAACKLREEGGAAAQAAPALLRLLADAAPVERTVCGQNWWRNSEHLTTPGEQAAGALVSIGNRVVEPLLAALKQPQWPARRNAAWALGALEDSRAIAALIDALSDPEPDVRAQVAWALGVLEARTAIDKLTVALKDADARVRRQAAWALGVIGDGRATPGLIVALKDADAGVRRQAAWAIGVIGK
jgi:HEAT repeat protein